MYPRGGMRGYKTLNQLPVAGHLLGRTSKIEHV